ncbi:MAG: hypothetical protein KAH48_00875 [Chlorobi bacterium]|nr:hypothetical protein [Chlorobiota bacterium]
MKIKKYRNKIVVSIFMVVFITVLVIVGNIQLDRQKQLFDSFYSTDINGIIEAVWIGDHKCVFKTKKIESIFVFDPYTSNLNDNRMFEYNAGKGDRIIKPAYSDTLQLLKNGVIYKYTFSKP